MIFSDSQYIIGCDECGYGSLAGSLVVCGVRAQKDWALDGLNDSKKLSAKKREVLKVKLFNLISNGEISFYISQRSNIDIDINGLGVMLKDSFVEIFHKLYIEKSLIIIDGNLKFDGLGVDAYNKISVIKADTKFPTVMAASILGKTYRDGLMCNYHSFYNKYDWINNMGYGSKKHINAIKEYGYSPLHRRSYKIKSLSMG